MLRFWALGSGTLTADETFSAVAAHLPFGAIWGHIATFDRHPPLSYYLLSPVAHLTTSTYALRAPAATCATLALVVFAWWQYRYGFAGLVATAVFAVSPFLLQYDRQARMFALITLGGVVAAAASDRWLETGESGWMWMAAAGGLIAALSYSVGILLPGFLLLVPGLRRDRAAWQFRLASLGAAAIWAVLWLGNTLRWSGDPSGYPHLTVSWAGTMVNFMVAPVPDDQWIVFALLAAGLFLVLRRPGRSRQLMLALFVVPMALMVMASVHNELLIPKTLLMVGWAPPVLLGTVVAEAGRLRPVAAVAVLALIALVVLPYVRPSLVVDEGAGPMVAAVARAQRPGDAVAMNPAPLGDLLEWYDGVVPSRRLDLDLTTLPGAVVLRQDGVPQTGRVWLVQSELRGVPLRLGSAPDWCGPRVVVGGGYTMRCLDLGRSR